MMMMRHMIRRASSTVVTSRPITPLTISHLLDFESKVLSDTTMSHESLKYLCEQGAVRTYTHNEHHTHIHTHTHTHNRYELQPHFEHSMSYLNLS